MYTGGTTGLRVLLDQRAEMPTLPRVEIFRLRRTFLHQTPMFHAASMGGILGTPTTGGQSVVLSLFNPSEVLDLIERHGVTMTVMVPTMIGMLFSQPDFRPERLRSLTKLVYGASPMPVALLERVLAMFPDLDLPGYGRPRPRPY
jgi:acyl-CoA synthetase (AMP-forming)/AMP-acid ligase II